MTASVFEIDPQLVTDFARDGVVVVRGLVKPEMIELLARGIDKNIAEPSPRAKTASRSDDPGWFF